MSTYQLSIKDNLIKNLNENLCNIDAVNEAEISNIRKQFAQKLQSKDNKLNNTIELLKKQANDKDSLIKDLKSQLDNNNPNLNKFVNLNLGLNSVKKNELK